MIAKVVFDLPLEEPFDYLIPDNLIALVQPGVRVKASFGPRVALGFVVAVVKEASVPKLKDIKSVVDKRPIFNRRDLTFATAFADYYGCSVGEALMVMIRHRQNPPTPIAAKHPPRITLYHCQDGKYGGIIQTLTQDQPSHHILVPDTFMAQAMGKSQSMGLRSSMFEAFCQKQLIIMVDEDNDSFKQEQSPMYEARQLILLAQPIYGFDIAFVSQTPSVELMYLLEQKKIKYERLGNVLSKPTVIDTTNYKFLDKGILSVPVRNALEANIKAQQKTLILFNRKGTFSVTRCSKCHYILKCPRCTSAMAYSNAKHAFTCHQCAHQIKEVGDCPNCHIPSWKSFGMGIEKAQKEIAKLFPISRIGTFERDTEKIPTNVDVLIATNAILRFKHQLQFKTVAMIDIDTTLSRLDVRSSFKGWSLLKNLQAMGESLLVQTRNLEHPMIRDFSRQDDAAFYKEEFQVRQELQFTPFYHWVAIVARSKKENNAKAMAQDVYNHLKQGSDENIRVTEVTPDVPAKLRDQYRFRLLVGSVDVIPMIKAIKHSLTSIKRASSVIVTLNIDP